MRPSIANRPQKLTKIVGAHRKAKAAREGCLLTSWGIRLSLSRDAKSTLTQTVRTVRALTKIANDSTFV